MINALGIGHEWNDAFLDDLTGLSGGTTLFASTKKDLAQFLEQKINAIGSVYGTSVRLDFDSNPRATHVCDSIIPGVSPIPAQQSITLGNLQHGKRQVILFEFLFTRDQGRSQGYAICRCDS